MKKEKVEKPNCEAKYGDKPCEEKATRILGNYGEMYQLCSRHYKRINKHLNLIYRE